jgi:hypothetical protein
MSYNYPPSYFNAGPSGGSSSGSFASASSSSFSMSGNFMRIQSKSEAERQIILHKFRTFLIKMSKNSTFWMVAGCDEREMNEEKVVVINFILFARKSLD